MSFQVSATPKSIQSAEKNSTPRRCANYHPSIWGDHFLSYANYSKETDDDGSEKHQELKGEIRRMLKADITKPSRKLDLIDAIQRLGVSYHFESDIEEILEKIQQDCDFRDYENDDLYYVSLQFRLLRQNGYNISVDVFNKFKDSNGNFKASLARDVRGMLSLYEATHLGVHGENILDEALAFSTSHLESMVTQISSLLLATQVKHALIRPIRRGLPRLEARQYMPIYQEDPCHNEALLTFAKLDFNKLQKLHQKELGDISLWWKDLDFTHKLPFARDRVVEGYFWVLGVYFEPEYFMARRMMTKVLKMISVTDDIYDLYGEIEELELFTSAIERWDISAINQLPEYMQLCYKAILDVYDEIETYVANQGKLYCLHYAKEAMKTLVKYYLTEAKWGHQNYVPSMEEYMPIASVSSSYPLLATMSFVGRGDIVAEESFKWLFDNPKMLTASSVVGRLMDDIVSHKFEQSRAHVASSIECYMKQHGATEEEAYIKLRKQVSNAWKDINENLLRPTVIPMPLLVQILNLTRVLDIVYEVGDGYTHSQVYMKDTIASLLVNPVTF